jgi:hypothetical protein
MEYNRRPSRTAAAAALRPPGRADCQRDPFFRTDRVLSLRPTAAPRQAPPSSPRRRRAVNGFWSHARDDAGADQAGDRPHLRHRVAFRRSRPMGQPLRSRSMRRRHHRHPERARGPGQSGGSGTRREQEATAHARRPAPCRAPRRARPDLRTDPTKVTGSKRIKTGPIETPES